MTKNNSFFFTLDQFLYIVLKFRIKYKINLLTFKALHGLAPGYISELLTVYTPSRTLRSAHKHYLVEKHSHMKKAGNRAFSVVAPRLWKKLPYDLIKVDKLDAFKSVLKTYYFKQAYEN